MNSELFDIIEKKKLDIVSESIEKAHGLPNECYSNGAYLQIERKKIFEEIERRAIDLSIEKVRVKLSESLSGKDYDKQLDTSMKSVEKGLKQVYS